MTEQRESIPERAASVIYETNEYERFEKPATGRPLVPGTLRGITETMQSRGFWDGKPMTVKPNGNGRYQILDGNHRFEAARELGLPVKYVIDPTFTAKDTIDSNRFVAGWKSSDYLHHYAEEGDPEYVYMRSFLAKNPHITLSNAIYVLGVRNDRRWSPTKRFKAGSWKMDTTFSRRYSEVLLDFYKIVPSISKLTHFNMAVAKMMRTGKYSHRRMLKKLYYLSRRIVKCPSVGEYLNMLEEIYNHKARGRTRVSFVN